MFNRQHFPDLSAISSDGVCRAGFSFRQNRSTLKRERSASGSGVSGPVLCALIYRPSMDLWHSNWLLEPKNETQPMFLSFLVARPFWLWLGLPRAILLQDWFGARAATCAHLLESSVLCSKKKRQYVEKPAETEFSR